MLRGVFFDLGGTLFSYRGSGGGGGNLVAEVAKRLGVDHDGKTLRRAWRTAQSDVSRDYASRPYFLHRDLFRDSLIAFGESIDARPPDDLLDWFEDRQRQAVVDHLPIRDDCLTTLHALKDHGLYLSIASNIDDDYLDPLVERHRLHTVLDHWTSSEAARACKPNPDFFRFVLDRSGLAANEVLFVGDSLHHDIEGANEVGMQTVRIVEEGTVTPLTAGLTTTARPHHQIGELSELLDIVAPTA